MIIGIMGDAGSGKDTVASYLGTHHRAAIIGFADKVKRMAMEAFDFSYEQLWGPSENRNKPDRRYVRLTEEECAFDLAVNLWHSTHPMHQKDKLHEVLGLTLEEYADWVETGCVHLTPRFALQRLGTEWGRSCYRNTWVDPVIRQAKKIDGQHDSRHELWAYEREAGLISFGGNTKYPTSVAIPDCRFQNEADAIRAADGYVLKIIRPGAGLSGSAALHASETEGHGVAADVDVLNDGSLEDLFAQIEGVVQEWKSQE